MDTKKKRTGLAVICTVLVITLVASLAFTFTEAKDKGEVYENEEIGIGIVLPPEYTGKYTIQSNEYGEAKYLTFLHTATYELLKNKYPNDLVGTLFRISRWPITNEEAVYNMSEMAIMLFQTDKFAYFLGEPIGVEYDESLPEHWQTTEYKTLAYSSEMIAKIVASVYLLADTDETVQPNDTQQLNDILGEAEQPNELATSILYANERLGFSIEFPESWEDLYGVSENYVELNSWGAAGIIVYQKASHDTGTTNATGRLFNISRWIGWR